MERQGSGGSKRPRNEADERIVEELLDQELARKEEKQNKKKVRFSEPPPGPSEAGPSDLTIKEELTDKAVSERAKKRREKARNAETEWVEDVRGVEEDLDENLADNSERAEEGIKFMPFNLKEERDEGYFDEDGTYVRNKETGPRDAWLNSAEVCSAAAKRHHEEMQQRLQASDKVGPLPMAEVLRLKRTIVGLLNRRETVLQALRRYGSKPKKPQGKKSSQEDDSQHANPHAFSELTECADTLMSNGEVDVYSTHKEEFEHEISVFGPSKSGVLSQTVDDGEDLFASSDDEKKDTKTEKKDETNVPGNVPDQQNEGQVQLNGNTSVPNSTVTDTVEIASHPAVVVETPITEPPQEDYGSWPISELKRFLKERGESVEGIVERDNLVEKVKEVAARGPEGEVANAPMGYVFDPQSGYFYSSETGCYFDGNSGCFYAPGTGKWYDRQWQEIRTQ